MTIQELESLYIAETGDKKPDLDKIYLNCGLAEYCGLAKYRLELLKWKEKIIDWLSARLEKTERLLVDTIDEEKENRKLLEPAPGKDIVMGIKAPLNMISQILMML